MMNHILRHMAATLAAILAAVSVNGKSLSSAGVFPFPREAEEHGGYLKLPTKLGISCPAELKDAANDLGKLCLARGIVLSFEAPERALIRLKLEQNNIPEHDQGYALKIDAGGIEIAARAEAGLFYGLQTLRAMLTTAGSAGLPYCRIADFPRFDRRGVAFSLHGADPGRLDQLKMLLRTAAALKYNCAAIEFAENFPYRDDPFRTRDRRFTAADIAELVTFAEAHFIRIVPLLRIWNDCPMLAAYPQRDDLLEQPYGVNMRYSYCPRNPGVAALIGKVVAGQTEFLHPECFIFHLDRTGSRQAMRKCGNCRDTAVGKLAADHFAELEKICAANGVKPKFILSADPSRRPGRKRENRTDRIAEAPLGHPALMRENIRRAAAAGQREFILDGIGSIRNGTPLPLNNNSVYSVGGLVEGAGYLWSGAESPRHTDATAYFFTLFHERHDSTDTVSASPVPIDRAVNAALNNCGDFPEFSPEQLKELVAALAARPEKFSLTTGRGGSYYGIRLAGEYPHDRYPVKAEIALGGVNATGLHLLLSCTKPPQQAAYSPWHGGVKSFAKPVAATVTVNYEKGKSLSIPLRYMNGIADWNHPYGGYKLRTAAALRDTLGRSCRFDTLRLKNPHPEQPIKSVVLSSARCDGIAPVLLALSLENAQGGKLPAGSFSGVALSNRVKEEPDRDRNIQWDFEDSSLKNAYVETPNMVFPAEEKVKIDYVVDTASPSHDRVLRLTIPPATAQDPTRPLKRVVNLPWTPRGTVKSLVIACRIDRPEHLLGAFQMLVNTLDKSAYSQEFFPSEKWELFHTSLDNRDEWSPKVLRDVRRSNMRKAVFVFSELPQGVEVRLDDIGISRRSRHDLPAFTAE